MLAEAAARPHASPHWPPVGWDISALFTRLGRGEGYTAVGNDGGATTATVDLQELVAAARAELRQHSRKALPE